MRLKYKCSVCGATGWSRGWSEDDTNAAGIDENDPMEDACQHIKNGGDYELVDLEYEDSE